MPLKPRLLSEWVCKIIYDYLQGWVRAQIDQPWMEATTRACDEETEGLIKMTASFDSLALLSKEKQCAEKRELLKI